MILTKVFPSTFFFFVEKKFLEYLNTTIYTLKISTCAHFDNQEEKYCVAIHIHQSPDHHHALEQLYIYALGSCPDSQVHT